MPKPSYFDQAAEVLERALKTTSVPEQGRLLEEALRLNKLAVAEQRRERAAMTARSSDKSSEHP